PDAAEHRPRATPERQEADATLVQLVQVLVGGPLRIEDQFARWAAGAFLPELGDAEDLGRLLVLGDAGVGIAQDAGGGSAGQKNQDAVLGTAAARNVVFFVTVARKLTIWTHARGW